MEGVPELQVALEKLEEDVIARASEHFASRLLMLGENGELRAPVQLAESTSEIVDLLNEKEFRSHWPPAAISRPPCWYLGYRAVLQF